MFVCPPKKKKKTDFFDQSFNGDLIVVIIMDVGGDSKPLTISFFSGSLSLFRISINSKKILKRCLLSFSVQSSSWIQEIHFHRTLSIELSLTVNTHTIINASNLTFFFLRFNYCVCACVCAYTSIIMIKKMFIYLFIHSSIYSSWSLLVLDLYVDRFLIKWNWEMSVFTLKRILFIISGGNFFFFCSVYFHFFHRKFFFHITKRYSNNS